ncbi:MAG: glycosyltransferase family 9 protein [Candidatus Scalindua sp.]
MESKDVEYLVNNHMIPISKFRPRKILIVARGGIGNVLMFTPTLRALKKSFPGSVISMMMSSDESRELLLNNSDVNEIITSDKETKSLFGLFKSIIELRRIHFDITIVMHPGGLRSALWAFFSGARIRIGYDMPLLRGLGVFLYTHLMKTNGELHDVEQNLNILKLLGIDNNHTPSVMTIFVSEDLKKYAREYLTSQGFKDRDKIIGFHPGSGISQKWKRWPAPYYSELINMIDSEWKVSVLIFGDHNEDGMISDILSGINGSVKALKITDKTLMESAALIDLCQAFIGNDSGLMHIAAANNVPTFCIAGPTDIKKTAPYGPDSHIVYSNLECLFCYNFNTVNFKCPQNIPYKCLNELYPKEVYKQIQPILCQSWD